MKTIKLFFAITMLSFFTGNAQITKGNWLVGGSAGFNYSKLETENGSKFSGHSIAVNPNIGYFFYDKFAIGLSPGFSYNKASGGSSSTSIGVGPFARYYFLENEKMINLLAEAGFNIGTSKTQNQSSSSSSSYRFKAGPVLYFNSSVALELTLNYHIINDSFYKKNNHFLLGFGFQIHLEK